MKIIDLTHTIKKTMPVYPGTEQPELSQASTLEKDGFRETLLTMYSHTGTHMDAPAHIYPDGKELDQYPAEHFTGRAFTLDCTALGSEGIISMDLFAPCQTEINETDFLLFYTGWDKRWNDDSYFSGYPCPNEEVMDYLVQARKKGVGMDSISIDPTEMTHLPNHKKLLKLDYTVIIENLTNLDQTLGGLFSLSALPLKYLESDGAPVRAIAVLEQI